MNVASPTFANPLFRQAIVKAVDRDPGRHRHHPRPRARAPGSSPPACPGSSEDPCGDALRLRPRGGQGAAGPGVPRRRHPDRSRSTPTTIPGSVKLASVVQLGLAAVGIPVELKALPLAEYQRFVTTGQQQLFRTGWVGLAPSGAAYLDPLFRSGSLDNTTSFSSADIDSRAGRRPGHPDADSRNQQYAAIETSILGQSPVLPLGSYLTAVALGHRRAGVPAPPRRHLRRRPGLGRQASGTTTSGG